MFLACAAILAFSLACNGGGASSPTPSPPASMTDATPGTAAACAPARPATPGESTVVITSGGVEHTYILHIPSSYTGAEQTPLVLLFHGFSMGSRLMLDVTAFGALADSEGFIVASLQGAGDPPRWGGLPPVQGAQDLGFVKDVLDKLQADLCINPDRVFAAGYSNGGGMTQLVACEMAGRIAAVGVVAATYQSCPGRSPVIAFHGIADPIVPFDGGENPPERGGGIFPPVRRSVSEWAVSLGCDGLATISKVSTNVELSTYHNCTVGDGEALLYAVVGGGHTWPGAAIELPAQLVGITTQEVDATALMWEFFRTHPLAH